MREDKLFLKDMLEAIENIRKYAGQGIEIFQNNELIQTWMIHHLQIIGEAARKISEPLKKQYPEIPWNQIIAMRHILVHDYFGVDINEIWFTIEKDIPVLNDKIQFILFQNCLFYEKYFQFRHIF